MTKEWTWNSARAAGVMPQGWLDLSGANLSGANLSGANLSDANLRCANLSGCRGLLCAADWLRDSFETTESGIIVYKRVGETFYNQPASWKIEDGGVITEICNPCRTTTCGCGVNFGTRAWCEKNCIGAALWECLIEWIDLAGVVVPYLTDGKARCERMTLLRKVNP